MKEWFDKVYNNRQFKPFKVEGELPQINGRILVADFAFDRSGTFRFGKGVVINSSFEANPVGGTRTALLFKGPNAIIEIDDHTGMSNVMIAAYEKVSIGRHVTLGAGCKIMDTDFHPPDLQERIDNVNIPHKPVRIEDGAFIGTNAIICKGVTIGREAIIAAGSVVTKDVPVREVWGGNPARSLKTLPPSFSARIKDSLSSAD